VLREGQYTGAYRTPAIGGESLVQSAEHRLEIDEQNVIKVQSPIWEEPYTIGDGGTFKDPRTDKFLQLATIHQFHHFTTRQLSLVEEFETRPGTSRFVRLGGLLDSARVLQDLEATFEQIVQTVISDFAHPAGSHLRGDFMVGDYEKQDSHDGDLWEYLNKSGLVNALTVVGLLDRDGRLAGSHYTMEQLADPRNPRHADIVECDRPDPNADRLPFTMHEGVLIHDQSEVQEAMSKIIRVETPEGERMALTDVEAARLLYKLAVRHQSESWAEPIHRVNEELVLLPDRYIFCKPDQSEQYRTLQDYYPVDYARTDEMTWREQVEAMGNMDPFIPNILAIARSIAKHQQEHGMAYRDSGTLYKGPVCPDGVTIQEGSERPRDMISISGDEIWVALKKPKYRGPVDSLVVTANGLRRVSEIDPELRKFAMQQRSWVVPLLAKIRVPMQVAREIDYGLRTVNRHWSDEKRHKEFENPTHRKSMPAELVEERIAQARHRTFTDARVD